MDDGEGYRVIKPGPYRCDQCGFNAQTREEFPVVNDQYTCPKCGVDESGLYFPDLVVGLVCSEHGVRFVVEAQPYLPLTTCGWMTYEKPLLSIFRGIRVVTCSRMLLEKTHPNSEDWRKSQWDRHSG